MAQEKTTSGRTGVTGAASMADLAAGLLDDAQELARLEIDLAKQEVKELVKSNLWAIAFFAVAGVLGMFALLTMLEILVIQLVGWHWGPGAAAVGSLVVLLIYLVAAGILALIGKSRVQVHPPQKTINSLKETKEWAARQMRSPAK